MLTLEMVAESNSNVQQSRLVLTFTTSKSDISLFPVDITEL